MSAPAASSAGILTLLKRERDLLAASNPAAATVVDMAIGQIAQLDAAVARKDAKIAELKRSSPALARRIGETDND